MGGQHAMKSDAERIWDRLLDTREGWAHERPVSLFIGAETARLLGLNFQDSGASDPVYRDLPIDVTDVDEIGVRWEKTAPDS